MPENAVRAVLEAYTVAGVIGLARRDGNRRYYDLLERLLPAELLAHEVPEREQLRHKLLSRYRSHGLLAAGGAGGTFARIAAPQDRNELRKELVELGVLVPVDVEGVRGKRFVLADEVALLQAPPGPTTSVAFIAPFDSLLWDTALLASLFDFEYVWEGFFPPAKRRWGYYVLPIVFGDRFVGRIGPKIERADGRVDVLNLWWENGFAPRSTEGFVEAMRDALRAYLRFAGMSPPRVANPPRSGETALPHSPVTKMIESTTDGTNRSTFDSLSNEKRRGSPAWRCSASGCHGRWRGARDQHAPRHRAIEPGAQECGSGAHGVYQLGPLSKS